jgi:hypothetical protein
LYQEGPTVKTVVDIQHRFDRAELDAVEVATRVCQVCVCQVWVDRDGRSQLAGIQSSPLAAS